MTGDVWTVLLSGTVGILLGGVVQATVARYATFKEGNGIAAAIRAEIEAILSTWNRMNWDEVINSNISRLENARHRPTHNDVFALMVNPKPFQVFDSLSHKIGLLGNLSAQVVGVYVLGKGLLSNIGALWDLRERLLAGKITVDRDALLGATRGVARLLEEFRAAGSRTATALAAREGRRWLRVF